MRHGIESPIIGLVMALIVMTMQPASAGSLESDQVKIIDGDTLEVAGERVRLLGIDAPEIDQYCRDEIGAPWQCGKHAAAALANYIGTDSILCYGTERDVYGRWLMHCYVRGQAPLDIAKWMVRRGWAWAWPPDHELYGYYELEARKAALGVHRGSAVRPWEWRREAQADMEGG